MNVPPINTQAVLHSMSIELANLKSADAQQGKQLQGQMQQQLQQLQEEQVQAAQDSSQQALGSLIDVNA
jgi:hypothetical protein